MNSLGTQKIQQLPAICEHIKDDGVQCGGFAISGDRYCRFHQKIQSDKVAPSDLAYDFPVLETEQSIQIAIMQMMRGVLKGRITERKAAIMLSGIKAAAAILRRSREVTPRENLMNELASELKSCPAAKTA